MDTTYETRFIRIETGNGSKVKKVEIHGQLAIGLISDSNRKHSTIFNVYHITSGFPVGYAFPTKKNARKFCEDTAFFDFDAYWNDMHSGQEVYEWRPRHAEGIDRVLEIKREYKGN